MLDTTDGEATPTLGTRVARSLKREEPGTNAAAVRAALDAFLDERAEGPDVVPGKGEVSAWLQSRMARLGRDRACTDFAWLQKGAARLWGPAETAHFAIVLREARVTRKPPRAGEWDRAARAVSRLPDPWHAAMRCHVRWTGSDEGTVSWSASRVTAVADALARWHAHCDVHGLDVLPTGTTLEAYARWLHAPEGGGLSRRSVSDYLGRIVDGVAMVVAPGLSATACAFVVRDWRERADKEGAPTKCGVQLVSASAIYELGFDCMDQARALRTRSTRAATLFRNGLLLATAVALPRRARALSVLEYGRTLWAPDAQRVHVRIPARHLKLPEAEKAGPPFEAVLHNPGLASAVIAYIQSFRPIFDDGALLFPSTRAPGEGLSESRLGQLVGDLTEAHLGVRVSIHRVRDNAATECGESVPGGARPAAPLLGNRDRATTDRHYDRSDGLNAAKAFDARLEARRSAPEDLLL